MKRSLGLLAAATAALATLAAQCLAAVQGAGPAAAADRTGQIVGTQALEVGDCGGLIDLRLVNTTVGTATTVSSGGASFCRVAGVARPTSDSRINFEIWLPSPLRWNGKMYASGAGGSLGAIGHEPMRQAVARGYAALSQDRGHASRDDKGSELGSDGSWAMGHPEKIIDWSHRSQHVSTVAAKAVITAYYGKPAQRAYFHGCSAGGHQAVLSAERYPGDYDGIIAGAPGWSWTHSVATRLWSSVPGLKSRQNWIPPEKLAVLHKAVLERCDGADGAKDGLISRPYSCTFDPAELRCRSGDGPACLTAAQVDTAQKLYGGPRQPNGQSIGGGWLRGSELGWAQYNSEITPGSAADFFRYWVFENPAYDSRTFDFARDWAAINDKPVAGGTMRTVTNGVGDLEGFRRSGGKMIWWTGAADANVTPHNAVEYHDAVIRNGSRATADEAFRLFIAPGVAHCGRGEGPDRMDLLGALEEWVERGKAPERIIATKVAADGTVTRSLPLCPYPQTPKYVGGDMLKAESFVCSAAESP